MKKKGLFCVCSTWSTSPLHPAAAVLSQNLQLAVPPEREWFPGCALVTCGGFGSPVPVGPTWAGSNLPSSLSAGLGEVVFEVLLSSPLSLSEAAEARRVLSSGCSVCSGIFTVLKCKVD